jgi:uncharacterized membrane protein SpoIIM required for sporulation
MSTFASRHKKDWEELEVLVGRARGWFTSLSSAERERLDALYRQTTVHLARVATRSNDKVLLEYLNRLTAAAHSIIYLPPRQSTLARIVEFLTEGFARAIARNWRPIAISTALVISGVFLGYCAAMADPVLAHALWPSGDPRQPGASQEQLLEVLRGGRDQSGGEKFFFSSFLFQNNLRVALMSIASGLLAGVPTVFLLIQNGMHLGAFAAIHHQADIRAELWAWILPHGITEIGAIMLCGGIGLMLGRAVVSPGTLTRTQSLLNTGREAGTIAIGAGLMLVAAAFIESYIRQSHWSTAARFAFAASTAAFWAAYIVLGFVRERQARRAIEGVKPQAAMQV